MPTTDPLISGLILLALAISAFLYLLLIRRRHVDGATLSRSMHSIADNYGRSGLP
jgi:hypothetical protein